MVRRVAHKQASCLFLSPWHLVANEETRIGFALIAQLGLLVVVGALACPLYQSDIVLFSGHPISQLLGFVFLIQAILILQPTHLPAQKIHGARAHALLHAFSLSAFVAGITVIEYNKSHNRLGHFHSVHAYVGVVTCIILALQYLVGFTMWATPRLYGNAKNAGAVWKYHRLSGYLVAALLLVSLITAMKTDFVKNVLQVNLTLIILGCVLIVVGSVPQIDLTKLKGAFGT